MTPSESHPSDQPHEPSGGRDPNPSLEVLAIDFIDVNRSLTLATQLANLARLWAHHAHVAQHVLHGGLGGLGAIAGEIDRLLLDCQYLLPRLAEIVDRYATDGGDGTAAAATSFQGLTITVNGAPLSLRDRVEREYGGDVAVAAADLSARAVVAAETHRVQLWRAFGQAAQGESPPGLWPDHAHIKLSFGPPASLTSWLTATAQSTIAWLVAQLGIR